MTFSYAQLVFIFLRKDIAQERIAKGNRGGISERAVAFPTVRGSAHWGWKVVEAGGRTPRGIIMLLHGPDLRFLFCNHPGFWFAGYLSQV